MNVLNKKLEKISRILLVFFNFIGLKWCLLWCNCACSRRSGDLEILNFLKKYVWTYSLIDYIQSFCILFILSLVLLIFPHFNNRRSAKHLNVVKIPGRNFIVDDLNFLKVIYVERILFHFINAFFNKNISK